LENIQSPRHIASRRNKKVADIISGREISRESVAAPADIET
jgi:hypothetical protein